MKLKRFMKLRKGEIKEAIYSEGKKFIIYEEELPITLNKGTLMDFETKSDTYNENFPITIGLIYKNKLKIIQILDAEVDMEEIKSELILEEPFIAYNNNFEKEILGKRFNLVYPKSKWRELMQPVPYKDENDQWQEFDKALMKKDYHISIPGVSFGDGKNIPYLWQAYKLTQDPWTKANIIYNIMMHNRQCLMKELLILSLCEEREGT